MDVRLPQLAEGVESGTVVNILVSEGQEIQKDQAFMELETQKAVGSIPSPASGTVSKGLHHNDQFGCDGDRAAEIARGASPSTAPGNR